MLLFPLVKHRELSPAWFDTVGARLHATQDLWRRDQSRSHKKDSLNFKGSCSNTRGFSFC